MRANSERRNLLAAAARTAGALTASYCFAIFAQQSAPTAIERELAQKLERVVVTGSRLPQIEGATALPVQIITREDIERSGVTTPTELLERLPINVNSFTDALTVDSGSRPGLSSANLARLGRRLDSGSAQFGFNPQLASPLGRLFYLRATYAWK